MKTAIFTVSPRLPKAEERPAVWRKPSPAAQRAIRDAAHYRETRARLADLEREREALETDAEEAKAARLARLRASLHVEAKIEALRADLPRRQRNREALAAATMARARSAVSARETRDRARLAKAGELVRKNRARIARQTPEDAAAAAAVERAERILAKSKALRAARAPARRGARRK